MKKIVLITMIFLCALVKAQVIVDPETFPIVTGTISDKNLYTNTGGEGKISVKSIIDSVQILDTTSITYSDFYTAITNSQLQVGRTYILIDFQTIYDQMDFDNTGALKGTLTTKTGAVEQIWVLALSPNQIADKAYSATYPKDEIQYDWTYNATLINGSPAKGRISERIDEWNNRTDYDHREIKFIRYDDGAGNFTVINDNGNASAEFLTFGNNYANGGIIYDNWLGDFYSNGQFIGQKYGNNVFNGSFIVSNKTSILFYSNTFSSEVYNNTFSGDVNSNTFSGDVYSNTFSSEVYSNTFSGDVNYNTFSSNVNYNTFSSDVNNNTFSGYVNNNTFIHSNDLQYISINGSITNKTIDEATYPFLFGTNYEKRVFKASDGNVYARYFDGTNDINVLIP